MTLPYVYTYVRTCLFRGKTSAATQLLARNGAGGVLHVNDPINNSDPGSQTVLDILKSKHPNAQPVSPDTILRDGLEAPQVHSVIFDRIDASSIRSAALKTKGAAGPSGLNAHCWRRLCTSFKSASHELCHSLALLARRLCTTFVDPKGLSALMACRLIALDKCPGIRPIGICETPRRIISKAILYNTQTDLQDAAGPLQLCAGQIAGIEAAVHAMKTALEDDDTEAVLLVDASNAFNSLNRRVALHNIRYLCPSLATILINIYRDPTELFVDGHVLSSEEGTTQGDPLAMPMYALATIPLMKHLNNNANVVQAWYADDAAASGSLPSLRKWWENLTSTGPAYGYHANALKTWLITKDPHIAKAQELFGDTQVNITTQGRPHLGAALGSQEFVETYVSDKVQELNNQLLLLADIARTEPQAAYAAFIHSFAHKFSYLCRTIPNIGSQLQLLEDSIRLRLIPALTGRAPPSDIDRELLALPVRLGGLGLVNPTRQSQQEYQASIEISAPLKNLILEQKSDYCFECLEEQLKARRDTHKRNRDQAKSSATLLRASAPKSLQRAMDLAQEKGASSWLTALPLEEFGLTLHKGAFRDAISLRYGWQPLHTPSTCPCGTNFTVEHALSCPKGGFPTLRHNEVRDLTANLMTEVCNDVCIEPTLQPVTGEALSGASALTADGARLDVAASGFWGGRHERAFFDVRVFNPYAPSNRQPLPTCYR